MLCSICKNYRTTPTPQLSEDFVDKTNYEIEIKDLQTTWNSCWKGEIKSTLVNHRKGILSYLSSMPILFYRPSSKSSPRIISPDPAWGELRNYFDVPHWAVLPHPKSIREFLIIFANIMKLSLSDRWTAHNQSPKSWFLFKATTYVRKNLQHNVLQTKTFKPSLPSCFIDRDLIEKLAGNIIERDAAQGGYIIVEMDMSWDVPSSVYNT